MNLRAIEAWGVALTKDQHWERPRFLSLSLSSFCNLLFLCLTQTNRISLYFTFFRSLWPSLCFLFSPLFYHLFHLNSFSIWIFISQVGFLILYELIVDTNKRGSSFCVTWQFLLHSENLIPDFLSNGNFFHNFKSLYKDAIQTKLT